MSAPISERDAFATKTCPTIRYCINETDVIQDGRAPLYAQARCIGSECMAWRWAKPTPAVGFVAEEVLGYCGLAGTLQ